MWNIRLMTESGELVKQVEIAEQPRQTLTWGSRIFARSTRSPSDYVEQSPIVLPVDPPVRYTHRAAEGKPGYYIVSSPIGGEFVVWEEDLAIFWMMYETSIERHGEDRANDLMFGFMLGMTHAILNQQKYPKVTVTRDAGGLVARVSVAETDAKPAEAQTATEPGTTTDGADPSLGSIKPNGQQEKYLVLSEEERAKGFVRPVRRSYVHLKCGGVTTMSWAIAETYARDPKFYNGTFCVSCARHFPLIFDGKPQFVWDGTTEAVGS